MRSILVISAFFVCLLSANTIHAEDAAELLKQIQSSDTSDVDRANAFEQIGNLAGPDATQPLAKYLSDTKWSHYARYALQKMPGEKVTQVLLDSIDMLQGDLKLGVIHTIGQRRDPISVKPLTELLTHEDAKVAAAASVALAQIGTSDAATALSDTLDSTKDARRRESLASALLVAGQRLAKANATQAAQDVFDRLRTADVPKPYRIGATQNAILVRGERGVELMVEQLESPDPDYFQTGLTVARKLPGQAATQGVINVLKAEASTERQVLLLLALRDRGDADAVDVILQQLDSQAPAVQIASVEALGALGDEAAVPVLLAAATADNADVDHTDAVLEALVTLAGDKVDAALIQAAQGADTPVVAIQSLGKRRVQAAIPLLFRLSTHKSNDISQAAIVALGRTASQDQLKDLVALWESAESADRKAAVQRAIRAAVFRSTQPDAVAETLEAQIPQSQGKDREFLFEQIRTAGGDRAVQLMRQFATGTDESLEDAATRTLGRWLSADAAPVLLEVAQGNGRFANRALGGYIRIYRQFELPENERVAMADQALKVAQRTRERNSAIDAMTRFPCVGTFNLALEQLDQPGSQETAAQAVLTIGRTVLDLDPEKARAGLERLIEADVSDSITAAARKMLQRQ